MQTFLTILVGIGAFLVGLFVIMAIWAAIMCIPTLIVWWLYGITLVPIFGAPEIGFWSMFGILWLIAVVLNLAKGGLRGNT